MAKKLKDRISELQKESDIKYEKKVAKYEEKKAEKSNKPLKPKKPKKEKYVIIPYKGAAIALIALLLWATVILTDYWQVCHKFEKPIFTFNNITADDGGSGLYKGLGYGAEIQGNFMPEQELPGVTKAKFYLFGKEIKEVLRD